MIMRVACLENGLVIQGGGRNKSRARDAAGRPTDRMVMDVPEESDSDYGDDAMEVDAANPNDFD
jgi:hypothetical protein